MSTSFTKALIRACKRRVSDDVVDFRKVISDVAMLRGPEDVHDDDLADHFAQALLDLSQCDSRAKNVLFDAVRVGVQTDSCAAAIGKLAHTRVADLKTIGLWDEDATA